MHTITRCRFSRPANRTSQVLRSVFVCIFLSACTVGPDYRKPPIDIPETFKEGVTWERAQTGTQPALSSQWWQIYGDTVLSDTITRALGANQSIVAAEAAYRLAQATVASSSASLFPVVTAGAAASRGVPSTNSAASPQTSVSTSVAVSWEPDLWGEVRRQIESSKGSAQASDALLAGTQLSVAASVAAYYFSLRQFDIDIALLDQQQQLSAKLLDMTRAALLQGTASNDSILVAQDTLESVIANQQTVKTSREQYEHAIAVLVGVAPAEFSIAPRNDYTFTLPVVPSVLPSQLLQRRPDIVASERTAAAANAKIGVAQAAFFPSLDLAAQGGFQHNSFAQLFSLPNLIWSLGPSLTATLFDGGARTAAVQGARATYDEDVALYRGTVLSAFQSVEDSLSASTHLKEEVTAYADIYQRNQQLFQSTQAQVTAGTISQQSLLTQQLTLLQAEQSLKDTQALLVQSSVTLIKNVGGGWQQTAETGADAGASGTTNPPSQGDASGSTAPSAAGTK